MSEWQRECASNLRSQLSAMGRRSMPSGRDGFDDELDALRALDYKVRCTRDEFYSASLGSNVSKNRFRDVLSNEGTRVILDPVNERGDGDYINANYVDARRLFGVPFVYIAAQAPLPNTVFDFWRMVFENNAVFIVMLCGEIEAGKPKSERYWPDGEGEVLNLGPLTVELVSENVRNDTVFRRISLRTANGRERVVHHLQYTRWPDQGIPQNSSGLMEIINTLGRSPLSTQTPIVTHCSGGIGRTGVFLGLHIALGLFELEQPISVPRIVQFLKYCRSGMVQRKDQYLFTYYAILREMERMLWEVDHRRNVTERMTQSSMRGAEVSRRAVPMRQPEHRPRHAAQIAPDLVRSSLRTDEPAAMTEAPASQRLDTSGVFRYAATSPGGRQPVGEVAPIRVAAAPQWSMAPSGGGGGANVDMALRELQRANQQRRQTPSHKQDSRGDEGAEAGRDGRVTAPEVPFAASRLEGASSVKGGDGSYAYSPPPRMSEERSEVGLHAATPQPDFPRYSAQPVTPSEGAHSPPRMDAAGREHPGRADEDATAAPMARPLPLASSPGEQRAAAGRPPARDGGMPRQSDVEAEIGSFDQSIFGVRRADPSLL